MDLELTNVVTISVSQAQAGVGAYNTSNLAIFSRETPGGGFGSLGYKIYLDPSEVIIDFGSSSVTAQMAVSVFSQQPNILAGEGYLVVIPLLADEPAVTAVQLVTFSSVPASGSYVLNYGASPTAAINWDDNAAAVQSKLRAVSGLGSVTVTGNTTSGFQITFTGVSGAVANLTVTSDSLQDSTPVDVFVTVATTTVGRPASSPEVMADALARTKDLVQYFGILVAEITDQTDLLNAAAVVQTLNKIAFWPQKLSASIAPGGTLDLLRSGSLDQNRGLYYGSVDDLSCILFSSAYAGRALSTNFSGTNTTQTMHLKDLVGIQPDPSMTQTLLTEAQSAGADVYASFQGVPKVFTSGANDFFDNVYNEQAFIGALQVAGFNILAETSTKLPQTEDGVSVLKGAYRQVCEQYVANQYLAPGAWTDPTTFGNQADFLRNISERGYYIFSAPVANQLPVDRAARKAPLIQIAAKEAGAMHSSAVIIFVNP